MCGGELTVWLVESKHSLGLGIYNNTQAPWADRIKVLVICRKDRDGEHKKSVGHVGGRENPASKTERPNETHEGKRKAWIAAEGSKLLNLLFLFYYQMTLSAQMASDHFFDILPAIDLWYGVASIELCLE